MKLCKREYEVWMGINEGRARYCRRRAGHFGPHAQVRIERDVQPEAVILYDRGRIPDPRDKEKA